MNIGQKNIKILIAPLDWGLGHTTRCIPIIQFLQQQGYQVVVACIGVQKSILKLEFAGITILELKGYNITYSRYKRMLPLKILWQIPKIVKAVNNERKWLKKIVQQEKIDMVISDNRYGLSIKNIPCIFITHQLLIVTPYWWIEQILQKINFRFINQFTECWVPDMEGEINMAGRLSHPAKLPEIPVKYIGPLSRLDRIPRNTIKYNWMVILSGPEPQKTLLEQKLFSVAESMGGHWLIVRGKPGSTQNYTASNKITVHNHLSTEELSTALQESEFVISRCGYTTVMEMLSIQKKCILIPTPGQTEQEYLAPHLMGQQWCYCFNQQDDFVFHLAKAKTFDYVLPQVNTTLFQQVLSGYLNSITSK